VEIWARVYRPRRAREFPLFRLVEQHLEEFLHVYPERFAGALSDDGTFHPQTWDADALMKLLRERLLARLIECHALSEELARKLLAWRHPGFSAHV